MTQRQMRLNKSAQYKPVKINGANNMDPRKGHNFMPLDKGKVAGTPKGMAHNYEVMRDAGYSKQRAEGAAYGEVGMEKMARRHESEGMHEAIERKDKANKKDKKKMSVKYK